MSDNMPYAHRLVGQGGRGHRRRQWHRPGHVRAVRGRGGQGGRGRPRRGRRRGLAEAIGGMFVEVDVTSAAAVEALYEAVADALRGHRHLLQQRRHQPARRRLHPRHRARGLAAGPGGQPDLGLPVLQVRDPPPPGPGRRFGHQHGLVRGRDGRGHQPDQLHGQQGRRAGHVPRARGPVRPPRACG